MSLGTKVIYIFIVQLPVDVACLKVTLISIYFFRHFAWHNHVDSGSYLI